MSQQNTEANAALLHPVRDTSHESSSGQEFHEGFAEVLKTELQEIEARRKACGLPVPSEEPGTQPPIHQSLVGLALSGGGIRSASFSLGVVQALAGGDSQEGCLKKIDYLSTVSGGGYLGACLSNLLRDKKATDLDPEKFPLRKRTGEPETEELTHLRNGSNYLNPPDSSSSLALPALVLRGILLTFVALLPMIYVAVFLTGLLYEELDAYLLSKQINFYDVVDQYWHWGAGGSAALFAGLGALYPFAMMWNPGIERRGLYLKAMALVLKLTLLLLLLKPASWLMNWAVYITFAELQSTFQGLWSSATQNLAKVWWAAGPVLAGLAGLVSGRPQVLRALGLGLATVAGPFILIAAYLLLCIWQVQPVRRFMLDEKQLGDAQKPWAILETPSARWTADQKATWGDGGQVQQLAELWRATDEDFALKPLLSKTPEGWWSAPGETGWEEQKKRAARLLEQPPQKDKGVSFAWERSSPDSKDPRLMLLVWGNMWDTNGLLLLLLWAVSFFINSRFLNINHTSPHGFYRDQLSRVFLRRWNGKAEEFNDTLKLSALRTRPEEAGKADAEPSPAPYHLINATVNFSEGQDDLRGRHGDFFLFSKHYIGGEKTGWVRTKKVEELDPHLDLGTAMAISAAAASPNMGLLTSRALSFLLMTLNVRLGYWLPNPRLIHETKDGVLRRWHFPGPGPIYLWKEALRRFHKRDRYVNVSDGGHIENLGVYELLRRRCRLIIAVDGEADPKMGFNGLGTLLRFARIDLGVTVTFGESRGLDALREGKGYSNAHWARGTITYGNGEQGTLLYLKSSLTGDEPADVSAYHTATPAFPHESTADQFFSEEQFEMYRALGKHIAEDPKLKEELETIFKQLYPAEPAQDGTAAQTKAA
jgi:hypothetical protein